MLGVLWGVLNGGTIGAPGRGLRNCHLFCKGAINIENSRFLYLTHSTNGAAVSIEDGMQSLKVRKTLFYRVQGNSGSQFGGAIYFAGSTYQIERCTFAYCTVLSNGQAIYMVSNNSQVSYLNMSSIFGCGTKESNGMNGGMYFKVANQFITHINQSECFVQYENAMYHIEDGKDFKIRYSHFENLLSGQSRCAFINGKKEEPGLEHWFCNFINISITSSWGCMIDIQASKLRFFACLFNSIGTQTIPAFKFSSLDTPIIIEECWYCNVNGAPLTDNSNARIVWLNTATTAPIPLPHLGKDLYLE